MSMQVRDGLSYDTVTLLSGGYQGTTQSRLEREKL